VVSRRTARARLAGAALAASSALLVGCAPGGAVYDKPGLTYEEWRRDDAECRRAAAGGAGREMDREAYARCMRARGYQIREDRPPPY
jgi:hypothetical protein